MDDRAALLRTQAMEACLQALGGTEVRTYGNEEFAGGVTLDSADTITRRTLFHVGDAKREYCVRVRVDVDWALVSER